MKARAAAGDVAVVLAAIGVAWGAVALYLVNMALSQRVVPVLAQMLHPQLQPSFLLYIRGDFPSFLLTFILITPPFFLLHTVANFQERMQLRRSLIELEDQNVQNGIEVRTCL